MVDMVPFDAYYTFVLFLFFFHLVLYDANCVCLVWYCLVFIMNGKCVVLHVV